MLRFARPTALLFVAILALAIPSCRDSAPPTVGNGEGRGSQQATMQLKRNRLRSVTAEELHRNNRMDFIGSHHNLIVRRFAREFSHGARTFPEACGRVAKWLRKPSTTQELDPRMRAQSGDAMAKAITALPFCQPGARNTAYEEAPSAEYRIVPVRRRQGVEVSNWASYVISEATNATDANGLASALQPVLDATTSMSTTDAEEVQALVSVAQSSFEGWQYESSVQDIATSLESTWQSCYSGNGAGLTLGPDAEGATYTCNGYDWIAASYRGLRKGGSLFRLASFTSPAICIPADGWRGAIIEGDITGFLGGLWGSVIGGVNAAGAISAYQAWKYAIPVVRCRFKI